MTYTITFTKDETRSYDDSEVEMVLKIRRRNGYQVADVKVEGKGEFISLCEDCGMPLFENDDYQYDTEGAYWHTACCYVTEWACEHAVNGCTPDACKTCEYWEGGKDV